jgi:Domain of unknown function (DUF4160)
MDIANFNVYGGILEEAVGGKLLMPTISMFYGIMVSIFFEDNDRHNLPHIHVRYSGSKASVAIEDGRVLAGEFPNRQLKMVQAWIEIHKEELLADWELAVGGEEPFRIDPLR